MFEIWDKNKGSKNVIYRKFRFRLIINFGICMSWDMWLGFRLRYMVLRSNVDNFFCDMIGYYNFYI